jgi:hypothetical protein
MMGVWLPAPRDMCNRSRNGVCRAKARRCGGPSPSLEGDAKKNEGGFWHTRVRKRRHTQAYMCRTGTVARLSQTLEICDESEAVQDLQRGAPGVSRNRDTVVV